MQRDRRRLAPRASLPHGEASLACLDSFFPRPRCGRAALSQRAAPRSRSQLVPVVSERSRKSRCSSATRATAPTGCSSSSRPATMRRSCSRAHRRRRSFSTSGAEILAGGERGLLGLAFHPQYAANGRFFVYYTRTGDGAIVIAEYERVGRSERRRHDRDRAADDSASRPTPTTTAACWPSGPTATSTSASATAAPATIRRTTRRTSTCCSARSCASTSITRTRRPARLTRRPPDNPFVGSAGRDEIFSIGWRNPVALQLRSRDRPAMGRPTSARARARKSTRRSSRAATTAGGSTKGIACTSNDPALCSPGATTSSRSSTTRTRAAAARSPAATSIAARRARCRRERTSTATIAPARSSRGTAATQTLLLDTAQSISSFGEDEAGRALRRRPRAAALSRIVDHDAVRVQRSRRSDAKPSARREARGYRRR